MSHIGSKFFFFLVSKTKGKSFFFFLFYLSFLFILKPPLKTVLDLEVLDQVGVRTGVGHEEPRRDVKSFTSTCWRILSLKIVDINVRRVRSEEINYSD